jgi:hypothetical protein
MSDTIKIQEKGIALCHEAQGFSANKRPISLLMKSDLEPEQLTADIVKALRQVTVDLSFEEYLMRFFGLWSYDAKKLAALLGFEIEEEAFAREHPDSEWAQADAEMVREWLEEVNSTVTLHKSAQEGKELNLIEQYELLKAQQKFEAVTADLFDAEGNLIEAVEDPVKPEVEPEPQPEPKPEHVPEEVPVKPTEKVPEETSDNTDNNEPANIEGNTVEDVTKSQEYIDLLKQFEELQAKQAEADAIIKAQVELKKAEMLEKAKALSFATEEDHEMLVEFMLEKANEQVVALLEKAQARIAELETEVEKTKEEFATAEHGKDGEPTVDDIQKSAEEILAENVAKALAAQANK